MCSWWVGASPAAEYSRQLKDPPISVAQVREMKEKMFAPLSGSGKLTQRKFENTMRKMLWMYAGPARNEYSLNVALDKLEQLGKRYTDIAAQNYHELMRVGESYQIMKVAKMMCHASLERKETRFNVCHNRTDYPETKPEYDGQIVLQKTDGE